MHSALQRVVGSQRCICCISVLYFKENILATSRIPVPLAGTCTAACARPTPWIFQHAAERFLPPYFFQSGRPVITAVPVTSALYGATFTARYTGTVTSAVLMAPAAVTHQVSTL
jgi:hypothetical protein